MEAMDTFRWHVKKVIYLHFASMAGMDGAFIGNKEPNFTLVEKVLGVSSALQQSEVNEMVQ